MKFNKNSMIIFALLLTAVALMATMVSVLLVDVGVDSYEDTTTLILSITLISITFCLYALAILNRTKPIKYIYISYSFKDKGIATFINDELSNQLKTLSKYRYRILTDNDVAFGEDLYNSIAHNIDKSDIFVIIVSPEYLQKERCLNEFRTISQKALNKDIKIIPIVLHDFSDLAKLPKDLSSIKALSLIDCEDESDVSQQIKLLAEDLIKRRKD